MGSLQGKLGEMPELKKLVDDLGRKPALKGPKRKLPPARPPPRRLKGPVPKSAVRSPLQPGSPSGLALSGSLARMRPSEAAWLALKRPPREQTATTAQGANAARAANDGADAGTSAAGYKPLFYARLAEQSLSSVEWGEYSLEEALPDQRPRRPERRPAGRGGPILVCLDTSWSMAGPREDLAKAVQKLKEPTFFSYL